MKSTKEEFIHNFRDTFHEEQLIKVSDVALAKLFTSLAQTVYEYYVPLWLEHNRKISENHEKVAYHFSIEFSPERMLEANLLNFGTLDIVKEAFAESNVDFDAMKNAEHDMALGNGDLGRLTATFMDSLATTDYPGFGNGLRYKYGLFKQRIVDGYQVELSDSRFSSTGNVWETRENHDTVEAKLFGDVHLRTDEDGRLSPICNNAQILCAVPYNAPQLGYQNDIASNLRLWDVEIPEEYELDYPTTTDCRSIQDITSTLYLDDSSYEGEQLRLMQEYFTTSAGSQTIIKSYLKQGLPLEETHEKVSVHISSTHPAVAPAEFMRLLVDEYRLEWGVAWDATTKTTSYTSHAILAEVLEKRDAKLSRKILPRVYQITLEVDNRFTSDMASDGVAPQITESTRTVEDGLIHVANLAIIGGYSINGIAKPRIKLLKKDTLRDFYNLYPEKFSNKTSGIVQCRRTQIVDQSLSKTINKWVGSGWRSDIHELRKLSDLVDNPEVLNNSYHVKQEARTRLAAYIKETTGIEVLADAISGVQVKHLHVCKRQLLNILNITKQYRDLEDNPDKDIVPHVYIFGARVTPGYHFTKSVIRMISELANLTSSDSSLSDKLKVVFLENYNISLMELIIPAVNASEQIPLTSKETPGTPNMKFMMTGTITLVTLDGANIEIKDEVGSDSIIILGIDKDDVYRHYERHDYYPHNIHENNPIIRRVADSSINGTILNIQGEGTEIYEPPITHSDGYFLFEGFTAYVEAQGKIDQSYRSQEQWMRMSLINIADSNKFISDDTITQYAKEVWQLKN